MEMEKVGSWWNELPTDFQTEICARLPVEFVYSFRMISKQWKDLLSSNYLLTKWVEAPLNRNQPRLVLCDLSMKTPSMAFCFYTRTWINSCFDFSFLKDEEWKEISNCKQSVGGLILVENMYARRCSRLCNPYTRTFVEIPVPHARRYLEYCIVLDEKNNNSSAYKAVAVGIHWPDVDIWEEQQHLVEIYEPSQKRWKIAGYFPENLTLPAISFDLIYYKGTFYTYCWGDVTGIASFTIPLEEGSGTSPITIPMRFVPFPKKLRNGRQHSRIITCGSRLLFISANVVSVRKRKHVHVISVWEFKFKSEEGHPVPLSNSPEWEWAEIARMPSSLLEKLIAKIKPRIGKINADHLYWDCTGVGDHVCFVPSIFKRNRSVHEVIAYNLIDSTWSWLPSCPISDRCVGSNNNEAAHYGAIAVEPNPHIKVE